MDQATRNSLQNATQQARRLLEREITEQLEGTFDVLPNGTIADKPGKHLDASQRLVRTKIVESICHRAGGSPQADKLANAVADYVREAAFTILNRYIALKMLEVRGLVQQCISKGDQSSGFKEFGLAATGLAQLPDKGYRLYLESLFDELSTEVKILFDRHSDASLLWPRRQAFDGLLEILNADDLGSVWKEDETIGWVYQYFNSQEERRAMRDASQAPRNSRELAVRNQFFTPRYVVEFLTDNTLGRTWYEMRQGVTALAEKCRYLVRRPDEVFLSRATVDGNNDIEGPSLFAKFLADPSLGSLLPFSEQRPQPMIEVAHCVDAYARHPFGQEVEGQWWPWHTKAQMAAAESLAAFTTQDILDVMFCQCRADRHGGGDGIADSLFVRLANEVRQRVLDTREPDQSQEELLRKPVFVAHRPKKDPRDLKILDPACGSSHFLIYCFDLLLTIYEEGWGDEASPASQVTGQVLKHDYPTIELLRAAVPGLILRHNLHGIDIDARCAQIGAFALWMRAQRAYNDVKISKDTRPPITKSNIVVAEPMPGEDDLLTEFLRGLREDRLETLIRQALSVPPDRKVTATKVMADSLCDLVRTIWDQMKLAGEAGSLLRIDDALEQAIRASRSEWHGKHALFRDAEFSLSEAQRDFWAGAESLVLHALSSFARSVGQTAAVSFRRGLFAEDAARALAFIDVAKLRVDVVLMNPPFGAPATAARTYIANAYPSAKYDLYASFWTRAQQWLAPGGRVGAITNRTGFFLEMLHEWRLESLLGEHSVQCVADLGHGVLDAALVEAAAYVTAHAASHDASCVFFNLLASTAREVALPETVASYCSGAATAPTTRVHRLSTFKRLPGTPLCYQISDHTLGRLFSHPTVSDSGFSVRKGMETSEDFRFVRLRWEVSDADVGFARRWRPYAKGGDYSPFTADVNLCVDWHQNGNLLKAFAERNGDHWSRTIRSPDYYGRAGLTYSERTTSGLSLRELPPGCVISAKGPGVFHDDPAQLQCLLAISFTRPFRLALEVLLGGGDETESGSAARDYRPGLIADLPLPRLDAKATREIATLAAECVDACRDLRRLDETDSDFSILTWHFEGLSLEEAARLHRVLRASAVIRVARAGRQIEALVEEHFGFDAVASLEADQVCGRSVFVPALGEVSHELVSSLLAGTDEAVTSAALSRYGNSRQVHKKTYWVDRRLELCALASGGSLEQVAEISKSIAAAQEVKDIAERIAIIAAYQALGIVKGADFAPMEFLVDDAGHARDIAQAIVASLRVLCPNLPSHQIAAALPVDGESDLDRFRNYARRELWARQLSAFSGSRRQAPVVWQIGTRSGQYSVFLSYSHLNDDALFRVQTELLPSKLAYERETLSRLRQEAGPSPTARQRSDVERQEQMVAELHEFVEECRRVSPLWKMCREDGGLIACAPLWRLFGYQRAWQLECKACWTALCNEEYDWSKTAMHLWPERVVPKCRSDRSLAIAHDLEDMFWVEAGGRRRALRVPQEEIEEQKRIRKAETSERLLKAMMTLATSSHAAMPSRNLWKLLEQSSCEDQHLALCLWPERVITKAASDVVVASRLDIKVADLATARARAALTARYEFAELPIVLAAAEAAFGDDRDFKSLWAALDGGQHDDQPLALVLWPERVIEKCLKDVELANTHGLRGFFWVQDLATKQWRRRLAPDDEVKQEVQRRFNRTVKDALAKFIEAPTADGASSRRRRGSATAAELEAGSRPTTQGKKRGRPRTVNTEEELF
jgi:hypothetical protein